MKTKRLTHESFKHALSLQKTDRGFLPQRRLREIKTRRGFNLVVGGRFGGIGGQIGVALDF